MRTPFASEGGGHKEGPAMSPTWLSLPDPLVEGPPIHVLRSYECDLEGVTRALLGRKQGREPKGWCGVPRSLSCASHRGQKRGGAYLSRIALLPPFARRGGVTPTPRVEGGGSRPVRVEQGGTKGVRAQARAMRHQG